MKPSTYRDEDEELRAAVETGRDKVVVLAEPSRAVAAQVELREEAEADRHEDGTVDADREVACRREEASARTLDGRRDAEPEAMPVMQRGPGRTKDLLTEAPKRDRADERVEAKLREELVADVERDAAGRTFVRRVFKSETRCGFSSSTPRAAAPWM